MAEPVILEITTIFTPAMDALRSRGFQVGSRRLASLCEDFDSDGDSLYLSAIRGRDLVSTMRLTPQPRSRPGVIETWTRGQVVLPRGAEVMEFSRAIVQPHWRRQRLFGLMICTALEWTQDQGFTTVLMLVRPDMPALTFLERLGFAEIGTPGDLFSDDIPGQATRVLLLRHSLQGMPRVVDTKARLLERMATRKGWTVTGLGTSPNGFCPALGGSIPSLPLDATASASPRSALIQEQLPDPNIVPLQYRQ